MKLSPGASIVGLLVFGTACSILAKLIYYAHGPGLYEKDQRFEKPWFQVLTMFFGMSICIVLDKLTPSQHLHGTEEEKQPLKGGVAKQHISDSWESILWINFPTLFDLFATGCGTTGLLYTSVSVYQMLRGAQLIFTALLSIIFLKRKLDHYNWAGICFSVIGITLVGGANIYSEPNAKSQQDQLFGVVIIVIGQVMQASQVVCEEFLLQKIQMSSVRIVAWEGLFGMAHMLLWIMPILYFLPGRDHGHLEDSLDSGYMFFHTWQVATVVFADMIMMLFYNVCGMGVTDGFSAVHRVIIETLRTLFVWVLDIFLYYVVTNGAFGESWTIYSWIQMAGFILLVCGTLTYNYRQIVMDKQYTEYMEEEEAAKVAATGTPESKPVHVYGEIIHGEEEEEFEEDHHRGSYYAQPFGSAAHSPFLAVIRDVGTLSTSHPTAHHHHP